jgi:hypothetical protein
MSISSNVRELGNVKAEIKRLSSTLKLLRQKSKEIEHEIIHYLEAKKQPGVKFQGQAIVMEQISKRLSKKKSDRESASILVLQDHGIHDAERVLNELLEARKGSPKDVRKLRIKKLKN